MWKNVGQKIRPKNRFFFKTFCQEEVSKFNFKILTRILSKNPPPKTGHIWRRSFSHLFIQSFNLVQINFNDKKHKLNDGW